VEEVGERFVTEYHYITLPQRFQWSFTQISPLVIKWLVHSWPSLSRLSRSIVITTASCSWFIGGRLGLTVSPTAVPRCIPHHSN
jgi:hypothetical protein